MKLFLNKITIILKAVVLFQNWYALFIERTFPSKKDKTFYLRTGTKVFGGSDPTNISVISEVFLYHAYFNHYTETPKTIIDIGANVGYFTVYAANKFPQAKIFSFEPFPGSYEKLERHKRENNFANVTTINKAVSNINGTASLTLSSSVGEHSLVIENKGPNSVTVNCIKLEEAMSEFQIQQCDFMKIDCEGSEYNIFYSLPDETFAKIKNIAIETHFINSDKMNETALAKFLKEKGYEVIMESVGVCPFIFASRK